MIPIFAHRGARSHAPENSLQAFRDAIALKLYGIELDVQMTKDGKIVVHHNPSLKAMTGVDSEIKHMTFEEVRKLRLPNNEQIPTLQEAFDVIKGKCTCIVDFRIYDAVEKIISIVKSYSMEKEVVLSCDDEKILKHCKEACPEIRSEFLASRFLSDGVPFEKIVETAKGCDAFLISVRHYVITKEIVETAHKNNLKVISLIREQEDDLKKVTDCGADFILSNFPDKLIKGANIYEKK